ncbi:MULTISPECIES: HNH endonuclease signature motif containing protein [unclassified Microbacterium]|uniref:HNH endonuclease signature motif containing protein n=1 Tax=unclassified Microbacterium TaxID=2609290 RepID=UPI0030166C29
MDDETSTEPYPGYWDDLAASAGPFAPRDPVDHVTDIATLIALHTAEQYESIAALRRDALHDAGSYATAEMVDRSVRLELAAALRVTEYAAGELLRHGVALEGRYRGALDALRGARITDQHARILVDLLDAAAPAVAARLADTAVQLAEELPAGSFRRRLRRLIDELNTQTLPERHERALADRRVSVEPASDGMAYLTAYLPAVEAHAAFDRLTRMGAAMAGRRSERSADAGDDTETRTLDQVRADVLCDLLIDGVCDGHATPVRGIRPTVVVTVPALSLLADAHATTHPALVEGVGPIPIERARELCAGAPSWTRVLTHPETGIALSLGRTRYDPPPELRRLVRWRAERCMAPGCSMPAARCEIDHTVAWSDGGDTALGNLAPLCTGHHTVKHHGGWTVVHVPGSGGVMQWTSPYGRRYFVEPERRMPVFVAQPEADPVEEPAPF